MAVFKTYSILMAAIFILSLRKLNAAPTNPVTREQKIENCIDRIRSFFGDGDTREHGKIALEHFCKIPESSGLWDLSRNDIQREGCFSALNNKTDINDVYGYYLSFEKYLDIDGMPPYPTFCSEIIWNLKISEGECVDHLIHYFGAVDLKKALTTIFYDKYQNNLMPKVLAKTKDYIEPAPTVTQVPVGGDGDDDEVVGYDVTYYYPTEESVVKRFNGEIVFYYPSGASVTYLEPNGLTLKENNEIDIVHNNGEVFTLPRNIAYFDPLDENNPDNTVNIGVLYIDRVKQTYGLNTAAMPPPKQFCRERYT